MQELCSEALTRLVWVAFLLLWAYIGHEGTVLDLLLVTCHMHSVFPWFCWPEPHITRAVILVVTLYPGLRGTLNGEAYITEIT